MQPKQKKIPLRMCTGCGEMKPKRSLIRVVHGKDGSVQLDPGGKLPGRGAYVCMDPECLKKARKSRRFEKSFSCRIADEVYDALEAALEETAAAAPRTEEAEDA